MKMLKQEQYSKGQNTIEGSYRVNKTVAQNLMALIEANENGSNYLGETPYAVYAVEQVEGKMIAHFAVQIPEDCRDEDEYFDGMVEADLTVAGFWGDPTADW